MPKGYSQYQGLDAIEKRYEARLVAFTTISMVLLSVLISFLLLQHRTSISVSNIGILIMFPLSISALYYYVKNDDKRIYELLILGLFLVHLNIRSVNLGSRAWLLIPWSYLLYVITCYSIGFKRAIFGLLLSIGFIAYFTYTGEVTLKAPTFGSEIIINVISPLFLYALMISYKIYIDKKKHLETTIYQKRETISKMILKLSNEINNPLTISKLCLNKLRREYSLDTVKRCDKSIDRISTVIQIIKKFKSIEEVERGLNKDVLQFYEELKNGDTALRDIINKKG